MLILTLFVYVTSYRWAAFRQNIVDISVSAKAVAAGDEGIKLWQHIGGAHYVSVTSGYHCVDQNVVSALRRQGRRHKAHQERSGATF